MIKQFKTPLLLTGLLVVGTMLFSGSVFAQQTVTPVTPSTNPTIGDKVCQGVLSAESGNINRNVTIESCLEDETKGFNSLVSRIVNIFSVVVGSISVIMIILGGFRYIISGGDSSGVTSAKNTILYAIVGLVIVLFSQVIIRFVISNLRPT